MSSHRFYSRSRSRSRSETITTLPSDSHTPVTSDDGNSYNNKDNQVENHAPAGTDSDAWQQPEETMTFSDPDDIFGSSTPTSRSATSYSSPTRQRDSGELLSELPAVRRQHVNNGFREGISSAKTAYVQQGFDDGFPVGAGLGLRVGALRGVLEGFIGALTPDGKEYETLQKLYDSMMADLGVSNLFSKAQGGQTQNTDVKEFPTALKMSANDVVEKWEAVVADMLNRP